MSLIAVCTLLTPPTLGALSSIDDRTPGQDAIAPIPSQTAGDTEVATPRVDDVDGRINEVQQALQDLRDDKTAGSSGIKTLEARLQLLREIRDGQRQIKDLQSQIATADQKKASLEARLTTAQQARQLQIPDGAGEEDIRERVRRLAQSIDDTDARTAFVVSSLDFRLRRRQELRELEAKNLNALSMIDAETGMTTIDRKLRLEQLQVEQDLIKAERAMFKTTDPNLTLSRKVLSLESQGLRKELAVWQDALNERLKASARQLAATARQAGADAKDPDVRSEADQNRDLAGRLEQIHIDASSTMDRLGAVREQLEDIRRQRMQDESRVVRKPTAESVNQMRARFTSFPDVTQINADIAAEQKLIMRARDQLDFLETISWLSNPSAEAELSEVDGTVDDDPEQARQQEKLAEIFKVRQEELVAPLRAALNERIDTLSHLVTLQQSLLSEIKRYKEKVLDRTIWIRDPNATTATNYKLVVQQLRKIFSPRAWDDAFGILMSQAGQNPIIASLGLAPLLIWLALQRVVRRRIRLAGSRVSDRRQDSIGETMTVCLLALFSGLAWAAPAFVAATLVSAQDDSTPLILSLAKPMKGLWQYLFLAGAMWSVLAPDGLAERHFLYARATTRRARTALLVSLATVPFILLSTICRPDGLDCIPAGRLLFTPVPVLLGIMAWLLLRDPDGRHVPERGSDEIPSRLPHRLGLVLIVGALAVVALASNLGWYRLILSFQRSIIESALLVLGVFLVRELLLRFLRARHGDATSDLIAQEHQGENVSEEAQELERLETRTLRAIRFSVVAGLLIGLYWVWRSVFPAFAGFDQIVVWAEGGTALPTGDLATAQSRVIITLGDMLRCFVALIVSWYMARNLPSLIELVIIDRFKLERGINYAITQLLQWALLISGLIYSASFLEISWSSVQWLAAGLTVGLGFGLQEIFANFISGLIILFERPIRLGDVVTVGGTNGRVSRIRMRSTTISDWDRKELVVPNKKFVTEEIVNWSIGDACIRLVLPVGVSYDEDPSVVSEILRKIGESDPEVLRDPAPSVIFHSFGDSSLDFELRLYLASTKHMSKIRTRINMEIKRNFDAAGISIPFPQRDIRVEMVRPDAPETGPAMPLPSSGDAVPGGPEGEDPEAAETD